MNPNLAREIATGLGYLVLAGQAPMFVAGIMLAVVGLGLNMLYIGLPLFLLQMVVGFGLIRRRYWGFYALCAATVVSFFGLRISYVPFIDKALPAGPETGYYQMAVNLAVVALAAFCYWTISQEEDDSDRKRERRIIVVCVALLAAGVGYWKTGVRTGGGEVARITELPAIGQLLPPLESSQPALFRSIELYHHKGATLVFRGVTTAKNVEEFAAAHGLTRMTNETARAKFLPILKTWKLDPERFPLFNGPDDLCYVGRLPKGSKMAFQICHRPSDGRYTAMAMGSVRKE